MIKSIILSILLLVSAESFALRVGQNLVGIGDSFYKVQNLLKDRSSYEYQVYTVTADIKRVYFKQDGMTHELIFTDGKLTAINSDRL